MKAPKKARIGLGILGIIRISGEILLGLRVLVGSLGW